MILNGKNINLPKINMELVSAGVIFNGLGITGNEFHTYDENGAKAEFENVSLVQSIVNAHNPIVPKEPTKEEILQEKVDELDTVIDTILTEIIPSLMP